MLDSGVALYISAIKPVNRAGSLGFWAFLVLLGFLYARGRAWRPAAECDCAGRERHLGMVSGVVGSLVRPQSRP